MANSVANLASVAVWLDDISLLTPTAPPSISDHTFAVMADDPWEWTIDRVVQELCTPNRSWTPRSANALVADPVILEAALRREGISGDILLTDVNDEYLKTELDMTMKAWRAFILHAVKIFKMRSLQYAAYLQEDEPPRGLSANEQAMSRVFQTGLQSLLDHANSARGSVAGIPQLTSSQIALASANASLSERSNAAIGELEKPSSKRQKLDAVDENGDNLAADTSMMQNEEQPAVNEVDGSLLVNGDAAQSGPEGKKRKRIAPTLITSEVDLNRNREASTLADALSSNFVLDEEELTPEPTPEPQPKPQPEPGVIFVDNDGKKRMVPILQSQPISTEVKAYNDSFQQSGEPINTEPVRPSKPEKSVFVGYLGKKSMAVANIFYDSVAVGEDIESEDETEFSHFPQDIPTGQRKYVNKMMMKFHQTQPKPIQRDGKSYLALRPYPNSMTRRYEKSSITMYTTEHGKTTARREHDTDWPEIDAAVNDVQVSVDQHTATFNPLGPGLIENTSYNEWDPSSLEKYRNLEGGDEVLPLYGDSDSDNEYDDQTWKEIEKEQKRSIDGPLRISNRPELTFEKVNEAIDEGITQLIAKWTSKALPKLEKKGWRLWLKSRKRNSKHDQILAAQGEVEKLNDRLKKLRAKMLEGSYTSSKQVHKQTSSMEVTVFDREESFWKISTLRLKHGPEKPTAVVVAPKEPTLLVENGQELDVEELESEHEASSSDEDLDDFIADEEEDEELVQDEEEQHVSYESDDGDQIITDGRSASNSPEPIPSIENVAASEQAQKRSISSDTLSINGAESSAPLRKENPLPVHRIPQGTTIIEISSSSDDVTPVKQLQNGVIDLDTPPPQRPVFKSRIKPPSQHVSNGEDSPIPFGLGQAGSPSSGEVDSENSKDAEEISDDEPVSVHRRQPRNPRNNEDMEEELSDDDFLENENSQSKKPKFVEDVQAREKRERIQNTRALNDKRRKELHSKLASQGEGNGEENGQIIVNDFATEGHYYLNDYLAQRIKKHQIEGLRFLWQSVVSGGGDSDGNKELDGCLLAHTMGLGKTMQAIALLVSIAEASTSDDPRLVEQVPERLRKKSKALASRTLVLSPPGLIDNWMDELLSWVRPDDLLGEFWKVDSTKPMGDRLKCISDWHTSGGVLILGYEMFRNLIENKSTATRRPQLSEEQHRVVQMELLDGPNIVIADEAHKMKNMKAGITKCATRFDTKCRIALTGSPLANNIQEYHTMIDWVSPNYLASEKEFRKKFTEPIQAGLYQDSTPYEKRKSRIMLRILEKDIDAKVQRADMSVLKHDMPPKTEFTITVRLSDLQKEAYSRYVTWFLEKAHVKLSKDGDILQATLWVYLGFLTILCSHPALFMAKLLEPPASKKSKALPKSKLEITETDDTPDIDAAEVDTSELTNQIVFQDLVDKEAELFNVLGDAYLIEYSNKVKVLLEILDAAQATKDQSKTLVFSQSIPTLDYLERVFKNQARKYFRLDGKTVMADRQKMAKMFNDDQNPTNIFMISTRAGGLGLNLPGANRVVIFDFKFNPIEEEQAIGRAYRIGQRKETFVYRLMTSGTFESIVYNTTVFKQQLASRVVDKKSQVSAATKKVSDYLFQPKDIAPEDLSNFVGMDPLVLDKLLESQTGKRTICTIVQSDNFEREDEALTAEEEALVEKMHQDAKMGKHSSLDAVNDFQSSRMYHGEQAVQTKLYDKTVNTPQPKMAFGKNGGVDAIPKQSMYMPPPHSVVVPQPSSAVVGGITTPVGVASVKKSSFSTPTQSPAPSNPTAASSSTTAQLPAPSNRPAVASSSTSARPSALINIPAASSATRPEASAAKPSSRVGTPSNALSDRDGTNPIARPAPTQSPRLPSPPAVDLSQGRTSAPSSARSERRHSSKQPPRTPSGLPAVFGEPSIRSPRTLTGLPAVFGESSNSKPRTPSGLPASFSESSNSKPRTPSGLPAVFGEPSNRRSETPFSSDARKRKPKPSQPSDDDDDDDEEDNVKKTNLYKAMSRMPTPGVSSLRTPVVDKRKRNSTSSKDSSGRKSSVTSLVKNAVPNRPVPNWAWQKIDKTRKKAERHSMHDPESSSLKRKPSSQI